MKSTSTRIRSTKKAPNRTNPVAQLSLAPTIHEKMDKLATEMGLSRSAVVAMAVTELFNKRAKSGLVTP